MYTERNAKIDFSGSRDFVFPKWVASSKTLETLGHSSKLLL